MHKKRLVFQVPYLLPALSDITGRERRQDHRVYMEWPVITKSRNLYVCTFTISLNFSFFFSYSPNTLKRFVSAFIFSSKRRRLSFSRHSLAAGKLVGRRRFSDRTGGADGSNYRRSFPSCVHFQNMDLRNPSLRSSLVPQPILLVPARTVVHDVDLGADRGGSAGPPDGVDGDDESVLQREEV